MKNRIKELRQEAGLTQAELGKKLGVVKQTVCAYEKGINVPNIEILQAMSAIFDAPIDYIVCKTDRRDNRIIVKPDPIPLTSDEQKVIDLLRMAEDRRQLIKLMEKFINLDDDHRDIVIGKVAELSVSSKKTTLKPTGTDGALGK